MNNKQADKQTLSILDTRLAGYSTFLDSIHTEHSARAYWIEPDDETDGEIQRLYSAKRVWVAKRRSA